MKSATRRLDAGERTVIIIVAPRDDIHATEVARHLHDTAPVVIVDIGEYPTQLALSMHYRQGEEMTLRLANGTEIESQQVRSVWWRRPRHPQISTEILDPTHRQFAFNEARTTLGGFWQCLDCRWINPIAEDLAAGYKPYQLKVARECGFEVPETLITNDAEKAAEFVDRCGEVIYKALLGLPNAWRETRLLHPEERRFLPLVCHAPVIFQELVPGVDLRVTVVGNQCFAAELDTLHSRYPYDIRMDMTVPVTAVTLEPLALVTIRRFMHRLGLEYRSDRPSSPTGRQDRFPGNQPRGAISLR